MAGPEHFADSPEAAAANLLRAANAGIVGGSIEDYSGTEIYDMGLAVERMVACVEAVRTLSFPFTLTARTENLIRGVDDLDDTIARLQAYESAGADVLYAPGLKDLEQIRLVIASTNKPINLLAPFMPEVSVEELAAVGVQRISIGSALANHAIGATLGAVDQMLEAGDFQWAMNAAPAKIINQLLGEGLRHGATQ